MAVSRELQPLRAKAPGRSLGSEAACWAHRGRIWRWGWWLLFSSLPFLRLVAEGTTTLVGDKGRLRASVKELSESRWPACPRSWSCRELAPTRYQRAV